MGGSSHIWEFGDSSSIVDMANDEEVMNHVLYSPDGGLTWGRVWIHKRQDEDESYCDRTYGY